MKNNFKILLIIILNFVFINLNAYSKEIDFKAIEILAYDKDNIIVGEGKAEAKIKEEIEIYADKITYNKNSETVLAEGKVLVLDLVNEIEINSNKIIYYKNENLITSFDKTFFYIKEKYQVTSSNVTFNIAADTIYSNNKSFLIDDINNEISLSSFKFSNKSEILDGKNIEIKDNDKNKYFLSEGVLRLNDYALLGKDIKVLLRKDIYGNPKNEPKLKGNSIYYYDDKTVINKGIFTSCGENNNCPPWSISSKEIIHYKKKQEIHYKNAWLKIYNKPVLYFPKFFHPDPSADRKSGFLQPTFGESKNLGASINIPYFYVLSDTSDLTFKPRFFSTTEFLLQSEFRKVSKNSSHIADFSLNEDDSNDGRNTHFFSKSNFILDTKFFDKNEIDIKIEKVSNDVYTRLYSLETSSPIIKDTSVLENLIEYSGSNKDLNLDISFESYETMNRLNSDRYEFIYPNYNLQKSIYFERNFLDSLDFSSSGHQKKFSTNMYEAVQVNDFLFTSNKIINRFGFNNNLKAILKNVNSDGKNSSKFKDKGQSEMLGIISYDIDLPLIKKQHGYNNLLTPKLSLRHSPNDTKNLKNENRLLNADNIFSLNRIGNDQSIEGGNTLTIGIDYEKKNEKNNNTLLSSTIATVFRDEINENLPISSTLGKKQSDFVGKIDFLPHENFKINYNYLINNDLDEVNLHELKNTFQINNFVNTFTFYEENNLIGKKSYYENDLSYVINENNSFSFRTRENKSNNLTEYYNLIYEYKNDCLTASIRYNKDYYSTDGMKPSEELFFNITLIPLGSTKTGSVIE